MSQPHEYKKPDGVIRITDPGRYRQVLTLPPPYHHQPEALATILKAHPPNLVFWDAENLATVAAFVTKLKIPKCEDPIPDDAGTSANVEDVTEAQEIDAAIDEATPPPEPKAEKPKKKAAKPKKKPAAKKPEPEPEAEKPKKKPAAKKAAEDKVLEQVAEPDPVKPELPETADVYIPDPADYPLSRDITGQTIAMQRAWSPTHERWFYAATAGELDKLLEWLGPDATSETIAFPKVRRSIVAWLNDDIGIVGE